jgi:hypothetical protein
VSTFWRLFEGLRRIVIFALGVLIIIFALVDPESGNTISMLVIGMVMVGILPVENIFDLRVIRPKHIEKDER